jgi:WXXGXW repeat (2 copies)
MRCAPLLVLALATSACFPRGLGLFAAVAGTAIVTAAIVSSRPPPPPRVVYVPDPRPGYAWQPGYWTLQGEQWVWVDGQWLEVQSGYAWSPTHWEPQPDGTWRLMPGQWVMASPPP